MIDEDILGRCLRISSSWSGLRISPLTLQYVFPRQPPLIPPRHCPNRRSQPARPKEAQEAQTPGQVPHILRFGLKNQQKEAQSCDPLLSHASSFRATPCFGHAVLLTVITADGPYAWVTCEVCIPLPVKATFRRAPVPPKQSQGHMAAYDPKITANPAL